MGRFLWLHESDFCKTSARLLQIFFTLFCFLKPQLLNKDPADRAKQQLESSNSKLFFLHLFKTKQNTPLRASTSWGKRKFQWLGLRNCFWIHGLQNFALKEPCKFQIQLALTVWIQSYFRYSILSWCLCYVFWFTIEFFFRKWCGPPLLFPWAIW